VQPSQSSGSYVTIPLPKGNGPNIIAAQVATGWDSNVWATVVETVNGSPLIAANEISATNSILNTYTMSGNEYSGAIAPGSPGFWIVTQDLTYMMYCAEAGRRGSYTPLTISYSGNPKTRPGGILSTSDGTAWLLDQRANSVVSVAQPSAVCPLSADATHLLKGVMRNHTVQSSRQKAPSVVRRMSFKKH
jgi:hypothetical protein